MLSPGEQPHAPVIKYSWPSVTRSAKCEQISDFRAFVARKREDVSLAELSNYPRDMVGYGRNPPHPKWPGGARIAIQLALNYEGGSESNILHGDAASEYILTDTTMPACEGKRSILVESSFEYGTRVGTWRLLRILRERRIKCSFFAVGMAIERNPGIAVAAHEDGHEIVGHGYRWIDYNAVSTDVERESIARTVEYVQRLTGERIVGWMTGRPSQDTRRLLVEEGGFLYDRDSLADELPFWTNVESKPHLCVPYSYEMNDLRCNTIAGFRNSDDFYVYLKDAFDVLYEEGKVQPKLMTFAIHDRIMGRPARAAGFIRFLDYALKHQDVWFARGDEIARHWIKTFPA
jgi:allantoinase